MEKQLSGVPLKNSDPAQKSEQGGERPILVLGSLTPTPISLKDDGGNYLIFPSSSLHLFHAERNNKSTLNLGQGVLVSVQSNIKSY